MLIFETARLKVRSLRPEDFEDFYRLESDPVVMRYTTPGVSSTKETILTELQRLIRNYNEQDPTLQVWAATTRLNNFVGTSALVRNDTGYEIGYRLLQRVWGQGYGGELCDGLIKYALHSLESKKVTAIVCRRNLASVKILDRYMHRVGEQFNPDFQDVDIYYELSR